MATVAQHSLDLADLLPALTNELATALGLQGLSLGAPTPDGERQFFAWGVPPADVPASSVLPAEVLAGETLCLILARGGRTVARLRVVAGRDLDEPRPERPRCRHRGPDLGAGERGGLRPATRPAGADEVGGRAEDGVPGDCLARAAGHRSAPSRATRSCSPAAGTASAPRRPACTPSRSTATPSASAPWSRTCWTSRAWSVGAGVIAADSVLDLGEVVTRILDEQPDLAPDHQVVHQTAGGLGVDWFRAGGGARRVQPGGQRGEVLPRRHRHPRLRHARSADVPSSRSTTRARASRRPSVSRSSPASSVGAETPSSPPAGPGWASRSSASSRPPWVVRSR